MQSLYIHYICILRREREKKNEIQTTNVLYSFQRFIVEQRQCVFRFFPRSNGMSSPPPPPTLTSPSIRMHKVDIAYFTILSVSRARESGHAAWRLSLSSVLKQEGLAAPFPSSSSSHRRWVCILLHSIAPTWSTLFDTSSLLRAASHFVSPRGSATYDRASYFPRWVGAVATRYCG
ncbi:unnamed protein product [Ixodes pacificus]